MLKMKHLKIFENNCIKCRNLEKDNLFYCSVENFDLNCQLEKDIDWQYIKKCKDKR